MRKRLDTIARTTDGAIQRVGAYKATFDFVRDNWSSVRPWTAMLVAGITAFWTYVVQTIEYIHALGWGIWLVIALFLTAFSILLVTATVASYRYLKRKPFAQATSAASQSANQGNLAKAAWRRGYLNSQKSGVWEIHCNVEFLNQSNATACFVRWGKVLSYMDGSKKWGWSKQTQLLPSTSTYAGQIENFVLASISSEENALICCEDRIQGHAKVEILICIELLISSEHGTQIERKYYAVVTDRHTVVIKIDMQRFDEIADA